MQFINSNYEIQNCLRASEGKVDPDEAAVYRERAFNLLVWSLFERSVPVPGDEEIIVSGYVFGDGKGDWFNMMNACKHLSKKFPDRPIRVIAGAASKHEGGLPPKNVEDCHIVYKNENPDVPFFSFDQFPDGDLLSAKVNEAACVLIGPIELPGLYSPMRALMERKGLVMHEYDAETNFDELCEQELFLGLEPFQGLGLFTRKLKEYSWADLENWRLRRLLFGDSLSLDGFAYAASRQLFLCYMGEPAALCFIKQAVCFAEGVNPRHHVDICYPCKDSQENLMNNLSKVNWEELSIGLITLHFYEGEHLQTEQLKVSEKGRELRIMDVGMLSPRDFRVLTKISSPLVGCTGDNSLATALSYGKIPFYEAPAHKDALVRNLRLLVKKQFGEASPLLKLLSTWKLSGCDLTKLVHEAELLGGIIRERHSANGLLKGAVNEKILCALDSGFENWKDKLLDQYLNEEISIESIAQELEMELMGRGLLTE